MTYLNVITLLAVMVCTPYEPARKPPTDREWLREYAFCKCFQYATDDSSYFMKRDISLSVYREFAAGYPESVYVQIDDMAKKAADNIKPSVIADYEGQKAVLKGCLTFYESAELKSFINTIQRVQ